MSTGYLQYSKFGKFSIEKSWIRTNVSITNRFTVCRLRPLGHFFTYFFSWKAGCTPPPLYNLLIRVLGIYKKIVTFIKRLFKKAYSMMPVPVQELISSLFFNLGWERLYTFVLIWNLMIQWIQTLSILIEKRYNLVDFFFDPEIGIGNRTFWYILVPIISTLVFILAWSSWVQERGYVVATVWIIVLFMIAYGSTILFDSIISGEFHVACRSYFFTIHANVSNLFFKLYIYFSR